MKFALSVILFTGAAFCQVASVADPSAASSHPVSVDQQNQNKAKALLEQTIQALGGDAYLGIRDISQEGRTYSFHLGNPTSAGLLFWRFYKYPDKDRLELTKKRDVVEIFNGEKGAEITYKGLHPMDPKDFGDYVRRREYALDAVLRKWINEPGVALFYEGSTVADQKSTEQVTIMTPDDRAVTLYLDSNTHLPVKKTFSWRDPADKQRNIEDEVYDSYRVVDGIMTPFVVTRYFNGDMSNQRFITSAIYNKGLDEAMFKVTQ